MYFMHKRLAETVTKQSVAKDQQSAKKQQMKEAEEFY